MAYRRLRSTWLSTKAADALVMAAVAGTGVGVLWSAARSEPMRFQPVSELEDYPPSRRWRMDDVARRLRAGEVLVFDGALSEAELAAARREVQTLTSDGSFHANGNLDLTVRSDQVCWITGREQRLGATLRHCIKLLRGLARELHSTDEYSSSTLVVQEAAQLACYEGDGGHFLAHRDADTATLWDQGLLGWLSSRIYRQRTVTAIIYLNEPSWDSAAKGGCLRCYLDVDGAEDGGPQTDHDRNEQRSQNVHENAVKSPRYVDVEPHGGRLVLFDSKAVLHEVLPSRGRRVALTVWIGDQTDMFS